MNTEQEIQLSDDLRHLVAGQSFEGDVEAITRRGRQARQRSAVVHGVAGLAVLALAAGGVFLGVHGNDATSTSTADPAHTTSSAAAPKAPGNTTPKVETAAYVVQQAAAALGRETDYIVQENTTNSGDKYTLWTDPRTGNTYLLEGTGAARVESWGTTYLVDKVEHWKTTEADYDTRTWFALVQQAAGPIQGAAPTGPYGGAGGTVAQIKGWLGSGRYQIVGHGESNGHQVTELRRPWAAGYLEVWVDSKTYQPVHVVLADFADESGPEKNAKIVIDESWVPRSADLVSLTNQPRIPAGFRQVAPPR